MTGTYYQLMAGICDAGFVEAMVTERELQIRFYSYLTDDPIYSVSIP